MKKSKTLSLVLFSIFAALILLMTFTPVGYLVIPGIGISATLMHIPVIVGAVVFGWKKGTLLGLFWGLTCMIRAIAIPQAITDPFFVNPLVSVVPRVLVGLFAGLVFESLYRLTKQTTKGLLVSSAVAGIVGSLTNTVFVLGALFAIYAKSDVISGMLSGTNSIAMIIGTILSINGLVEILSAAILTPPIAKALLDMQKRMNR